MELYQLKTFVTVAQQGHITHAAELLHLSQPAVTAQIKALEEDAGAPLFDRTPQGMRLTPLGQKLLPKAEHILQGSRDWLASAREAKQELSGKLHLGISLTPDIIHLGTWVEKLLRVHPLIDLKLWQGASGSVVSGVRKKEFNGGFSIGLNPYVNVENRLLETLSFCVVMPVAWQNDYDPSKLKTLNKMPWIGICAQSYLSKATAEVCRSLNISPRKVAECDHIASMLMLVEAGVGIALVREKEALAAEKLGTVHVVRGIQKTVELNFIYPLEYKTDPLILALLNILDEIWPPALGNTPN